MFKSKWASWKSAKSDGKVESGTDGTPIGEVINESNLISNEEIPNYDKAVSLAGDKSAANHKPSSSTKCNFSGECPGKFDSSATREYRLCENHMQICFVDSIEQLKQVISEIQAVGGFEPRVFEVHGFRLKLQVEDALRLSYRTMAFNPEPIDE
jgi:hypothetical protein